MRYSWDKRKSEANLRKHGISFARAVRIFDGPILEDPDDREDYGEERIKATGLVEGAEVVVIYTDRAEDERRIISARRATSQERTHFRRKVARQNLGAFSQFDR